MAGRKPDFNVCAMNKDTQEKANIGAAWINSDGSIGIKLSPFVHIYSSPSVQIRLFKNEDKPAKHSAQQSPVYQPDPDDDIPF